MSVRSETALNAKCTFLTFYQEVIARYYFSKIVHIWNFDRHMLPRCSLLY